MGLDIALGLVVLFAAVRGWFRGFLIQAIRLAGLVGCVYAAAPIRDYARPYVEKHLTSIRPDLLDRLLWWAVVVLTYVLSVGVASLAVKMARRKPFGEVEPNRTDQFGGLVLGAIKGAIAASFLTAAIQQQAVDRLRGIEWAEEQARGSYALEWEKEYQPAKKIWASSPVRHYVAQIRRMGLNPDASAETDAPANREADPVRAATTADRPRLELEIRELDPASPDFTREFDRILGDLGVE